MGRKIFVSYKYADGNVYPVPYISDYQPKVRDYVTWLEKKFTDRTEHIYSSDLSDKSSLSCSPLYMCSVLSVNRLNIFGRSLKIKYMIVQ